MEEREREKSALMILCNMQCNIVLLHFICEKSLNAEIDAKRETVKQCHL